MKAITFYSYKGGVGRTLAACNFAIHAARMGHPTVVIDFDLDAPGVDSKFPWLEVGTGPGLLQYILEYQQTGSVTTSIREIVVGGHFNQLRAPLWVIPAGRYLDDRYTQDLQKLDWRQLFFSDRDGVRFFHDFLVAVEQELGVEVAVIDSRSGITEIGGICTQQLGDEVVLLTSLSSENIRVTRHLVEQLRTSPIARELGKAAAVKVVISRIPKPDDEPALRSRCGQLLSLDPDEIFYLYWSPALASEEFIALLEPERDRELTKGYQALFTGLQAHLGGDAVVRREVDKFKRDLLGMSKEEAESSLEELARLHRHELVERLRFSYYRLTNQPGKQVSAALSLLSMVDDAYLRRMIGEEIRQPLFMLTDEDLPRVLSELDANGSLRAEDQMLLAVLLQKEAHWKKSLSVARKLIDSSDRPMQFRALNLAARAALSLGLPEAQDLLMRIPNDRVDADLLAVRRSLETDQVKKLLGG